MFKYSDLYRKNTPVQYLNERFIKRTDKTWANRLFIQSDLNIIN